MAEPSEVVLSTEALTAGYGGTPVIEDISLTVRAGKITAIVGPNGAGKSTLLKALSGVLKVSGGEVYVQGVRWEVGELGLPGREVELVAESHGRALGRFLLVPTPGTPISLDRLVVATALADQVGAALAGRPRAS